MLSQVDQNDLVLTLFAGLSGAEPWAVFLDRLRARTQADRVLWITVSARNPVQQVRRADRAWQSQSEDERAWTAALPGHNLRPHRVYGLGEVAGPPPPDAQIGDARIVQIAAPGRPAVWLILLNDRPQFDAADSALLSALIPAVRIAVAMQSDLATLGWRVAAAEDALSRLGVGQAVLSESGDVIASDARWQEHQRTDPAGPSLVRSFACEAAPDIVRVAAIRDEHHLSPERAAPVIARDLGLSPREASLAAHLATGRSLREAAAAMKLTTETARNYSKRIFVKAQVSGQADLVRRVLSGLAPLS